MSHQIFWAFIARITNVISINHTTKETKMVSKKGPGMIAVAIMALAIAVFSTACTNDKLTGEINEGTANVVLQYPEACQNGIAPPANVCDSTHVMTVYFQGVANNTGGITTGSFTLRFTRDPGTNEASVSVEIPADVYDNYTEIKIFMNTQDFNLEDGYNVQLTNGGDHTSFTFPEDDYTVLVEIYDTNSGDNEVLPGTVTLVADGYTGCTWSFPSDELAEVCEIDASGAVCTAVPAGSYTVDVSCEDGTMANENFAFDVISDDVKLYTVPVYPVDEEDTDTSDVPGDASFTVENEGVSIEDCGFDWNSDQLDAVCTVDSIGASCVNIAPGSYTVTVTCAGQTLAHEDFSFDIISGVKTAYTVEVTAVADDTTGYESSLCVSTGLDGCTLDFSALNPDPAVTTPDGGYCNEVGQYYLTGISVAEVGTNFTIVASCPGDLSGYGSVLAVPVDADSPIPVSIPVSTDIPTGEFCIAKHGIQIDLDTPTANIQQWLGFGDGTTCDPEAPTASDYENITVVGYEGYGADNSYCTDETDPNCLIAPVGTSSEIVDGVYQHLLFFGSVLPLPKDDGEWHTFAITLEYDNGVDPAQTITAYLGLNNGNNP